MTRILHLICLLCMAPLAHADHIPATTSVNPMVRYQHDASKKRFADIYKLAALIDAYITQTGTIPELSPVGSNDIYDIVVLGQPRAVDQIFENGTPFNFSSIRHRAPALIAVLERDLGRNIRLPIDPQKVGNNFHPVYFVLLRNAHSGKPANYIILGTFAQSVTGSQQVAPDVHLLGLSNLPETPFMIPLVGTSSLSNSFVDHILTDGADADAVFAKFVDTFVE